MCRSILPSDVMTPASSFLQVLAQRGRVLLFTSTAATGLRFEQFAERHHARVIHTRAWADPFGPVCAWRQIHDTRDCGVFSCDQERYVMTTFNLPCTDLAWVGCTGDPVKAPALWQRFSQAMSRGIDSNNPPRLWILPEDGV